MSVLKLGNRDTLYYEHRPPKQDTRNTFVFFNALTGDVGMWNADIVPALNRQGYGTLTYNFRGQADSLFSDPQSLNCEHIVNDALTLLQELHPANPILAGLSIGGLFAAHAVIRGAYAEGLVLINTLRRDGPRLRWINDALVRCAEFGGLELFRDLFCPLLFNERWLAENRAKFLVQDSYRPIDRSSGIYYLLKYAADADWSLSYERLTVPTLVLTGLQDRVFLDLDDVAALASRLPKVECKYQPDAGHMLPTECPRWLTDTLVNFAERL